MTTQGKKRPLSTREMILCALFTALIAAGAFIRIPIPVIPFTLQTLFVMLAGTILGSKLGAISSGLYLILGLIGLPIFTKGGGFFYIFQPTFGYILGFVVGAWLAGWIVERAPSPDFKVFWGAGLACLAVVYLFGIIYYYCIIHFYLGDSIAIGTLLLYCFFTTISGDIVLCILSAILAKRVRPWAKQNALLA